METQREIYEEFRELGKDDPEYLAALDKSYQQGNVLLSPPKEWHEDQEHRKRLQEEERKRREEVKRLGYDPDKPVLQEEIFKSFDARFTQGLKDLREKHPLRDDLQREIVKMGKGLDEELYKTRNLQAEHCRRRDGRRRLSYENRAYRYIKTLKSDNSPGAKMIKKVEAGGLATENTLAQMVYGDMAKFKVQGFDIHGPRRKIMTADTWDAFDVIASTIMDLYVEDLCQHGVLRAKEEFSEQELQALIAPDSALPPTFLVISWEEFKRKLRKTGRDRRQAEAMVSGLINLSFSGDLSFPTTDHGIVTLWAGGSFADILIPKKENDWDWVRSSPQFRHREKKLEDGGGFIVNLTGHVWGMLFLLNVVNRNIRILPSRFYPLSAGARLLFRLTLGKPRGRVTLSQITMINCWRQDVSKQRRAVRLRKIQDDWTALGPAGAGFIKSIPEPVEEEGELVWYYEHVPDWDEPQAVIPTTCR